jgi:hypothetical protein
MAMKLGPGILALALALAACGEGEIAGDVAGSYRFEGNGEAQAVTVGEDGSFANSYFRDGSLVWRDKGTWERDEAGGEEGITFSKFRFGLADHAAQPGYWFAVPERSLSGNMRLCFDPDLGHCFERK